MRIQEGMLGKRWNCVNPNCRQPFVPTEQNTQGLEASPAPPAAERPAFAVPSAAQPRAAEAGPMPASPPPPPPPAERAKPIARNLWGDVFLNAISVTFDSHKIALAALIGVVWLIGIALVGVAMFRPAQHGTELLSVLRTSACIGIAIGGIARLVEIELSQARRREIAEGLQFILRNLATLPFILLVLALGILLSQAIVNLLVGFLATNSGAVLGGILAIPLFLVNLSALVFLALEVPLVPCIMAVEDCGAFAAFLHLNRLFAERGGRLGSRRGRLGPHAPGVRRARCDGSAEPGDCGSRPFREQRLGLVPSGAVDLRDPWGIRGGIPSLYDGNSDDHLPTPAPVAAQG
jgi:hypothetical protein